MKFRKFKRCLTTFYSRNAGDPGTVGCLPLVSFKSESTKIFMLHDWVALKLLDS